MADRYEEVAATLMREGGIEDLEERIASALRDQDAWWPIDDPEHPAPRDGTPILAWLLWYPRGLHGREEYAERNFDILRWTDFNGGGWVHNVLGQPTHWRPLPPPPMSRREG